MPIKYNLIANKILFDSILILQHVMAEIYCLYYLSLFSNETHSLSKDMGFEEKNLVGDAMANLVGGGHDPPRRLDPPSPQPLRRLTKDIVATHAFSFINPNKNPKKEKSLARIISEHTILFCRPRRSTIILLPSDRGL